MHGSIFCLQKDCNLDELANKLDVDYIQNSDLEFDVRRLAEILGAQVKEAENGFIISMDKDAVEHYKFQYYNKLSDKIDDLSNNFNYYNIVKVGRALIGDSIMFYDEGSVYRLHEFIARQIKNGKVEFMIKETLDYHI